MMNPLQRLNRIFDPEEYSEVTHNSFMEFLTGREEALMKAVGFLTAVVAEKQGVEDTGFKSPASLLAEKAFKPVLSSVVESASMGVEVPLSVSKEPSEPSVSVLSEDVRLTSIEEARARVDSILLNRVN